MSNFEIIKDSICFEDVARDYGIEFNRSGKALCPFHDEKTPSFHNFGTHGYCFGCGKIADAIDLEAHFTGLSSFEAALSLAKRCGVRLPEFTPKDKERADKHTAAYKLLERFIRRTNRNIKNHPEALEFLKAKGLDETDIDRWLIGYVGDENPVANGLKEKADIELAREIGLTNAHGKDHFRNRIIFAIWNYGKIVFLTGRAFPKGEPKYLHLTNSELICKSVAFAENLKKDYCVITEGITDAIAFLKVDIPACASLGTNLGDKGREALSRAKGKLYFYLDKDEAGEKASYKLAKDFKGYTLDSGYDKDSDEVLAEIGPEEFKRVVEKAIEEAKYYLDAVIENESIIEALREITKLEFATEQELWLKRLSEKSGISLGALKDDLRHLKQEEESKSKSQAHPRLEPKPIDLLAEPKPSLHPAMDWVDENLIYGIGNGNGPLFIYARKVIDLSEVSRKYSLANEPQHSRFSSYGIKTYINGAEIRGPKLYKSIYDLLLQHIIFKAAWQIVLVVLWIIGTYLHRYFPLYPYLQIKSPTKRCGKTRLLELLSELCFNSSGIQTAPTEAVLYRLPGITGGTLCWDEAENLHNHKEKGERLEILNSSYRKGAKVPRCEGENHEVRFFDVFRPIALAGISSLPDTVADRALKVELIRKRRDEKVVRLQIDRLQSEMQSLRDGLCIFALERAPIIVEAYSQFQDNLIPEGVDDRLRDAFEILLSIAAGVFRYDAHEFKSVLNHLQTAAKALSGIRANDEDDTSFVRTISVLKIKLDSFGENEIVLTSQEAIDVLRDGGLDWIVEPKEARRVLRKLGFESRSHRRGERFVRGYLIERERIEDLSERYGG